MTPKNHNNNFPENSRISDIGLSSEAQEADLLWQEYRSVSKSKKIAKNFFYTVLIFFFFILIILGVYIVSIASNPF